MGEGRAPVVLVPGALGQDFVYWNVMSYFLERDGYPVFTATFPLLTLRDLRESATLLAARVEEVKAAEGAERVSLVAHSMGGLISRYYAKFLGGASSLRHVVFLGVPHHGTWTGVTIPVLRGTRQILPGSPFMNALNSGDDPTEFGVTNIYSTTDFIVLPRSSARLAGANVVNRCVPLAGHWGMLTSRKVYRWLFEALSGPGGAAEIERLIRREGTPAERVGRAAAES